MFLPSELFDPCTVGSLRLLPKFQALPNWPVYCYYTLGKGFIGWLYFGKFSLTYRASLQEADEISVWKFGNLEITRERTPEEIEQYEEAVAEDQFMEKELNRYTEWYY